jgi:hypothetical protein
MELNEILLLVGSLVIVFWGASHIAPTRSVVKGFGNISLDNRRIITMEWVAEGVALRFIGVLVAALTLRDGSDASGSQTAILVAASLLLVMAALTAMTGARTSNPAMKVCPIVKSAVAATYVAGVLL